MGKEPKTLAAAKTPHLVWNCPVVKLLSPTPTIQLSTPDALRGRVSSVNFIFIGASNQLGAAESGFLAAATSATFAVVSGGVGCLLVVALVAWRMPALREHRTGDA